MKQLPKDKRNRLILVISITILGLGGLWFGLIKYQQKHLEDLAVEKGNIQAKLDRVQQVVKNVELVETDLAAATKRLSELEDDMVSGDPYAWMYSKIKEFKTPYKVEIPPPAPPVRGPVILLPDFPYEQASYALVGTAFYHDFGKFLADFENHFPLFRAVNLDLTHATPLAGAQEADKEKLQFRMDVITLVKPGV